MIRNTFTTVNTTGACNDTSVAVYKIVTSSLSMFANEIFCTTFICGHIVCMTELDWCCYVIEIQQFCLQVGRYSVDLFLLHPSKLKLFLAQHILVDTVCA